MATQPGSVAAVIQARMGSTRLPGKVLRPLHGRPVLDWVIRAARQAEGVEHVIVATTTEADDDVVAAHAASAGVSVVRGSVDDVLSRFLLAADVPDADGRVPDGIVRLTADCPLLDPALIATVAAAWRASGVDYASTITPRCLPRGLDVELISRRSLFEIDQVAQGVDRTHVTSFVYRNPSRFSILGVTVHPAADDLRVTLDTVEDARLLDALTERLGDRPPAWTDVVAVLRGDAGMRSLNANVRQKALAEG
ncbi:MAG: glycosyltransferase family protein [Acidimicrobiales bacterium]|nr:glycosyltransferase family protein [Acidimicrobiales bacterium]